MLKNIGDLRFFQIAMGTAGSENDTMNNLWHTIWVYIQRLLIVLCQNPKVTCICHKSYLVCVSLNTAYQPTSTKSHIHMSKHKSSSSSWSSSSWSSSSALHFTIPAICSSFLWTRQSHCAIQQNGHAHPVEANPISTLRLFVHPRISPNPPPMVGLVRWLMMSWWDVFRGLGDPQKAWEKRIHSSVIGVCMFMFEEHVDCKLISSESRTITLLLQGSEYLLS